MAETTFTRFLVLSDTHNLDFEKWMEEFSPLPSVDVAIHCGDLTQCGGLSSYKKALQILKSINARLKIVIPGNHDLDLDGDYWRIHLDEGDELQDHDKAIAFWKGDALAAGVTYLEEGNYTFNLDNGARFTLYASPYQPEFHDMAFNYKPDEDRFNSQAQIIDPNVKSIARVPIPDFPGVDVMVTHGPPNGFMDECKTGHAGCKNILRALKRAKPQMHCFGHIHEGYGACKLTWNTTFDTEKREDLDPFEGDQDEDVAFAELTTPHGEQTLLINAAIMTGDYEPNNAPWVINLKLPTRINSMVDPEKAAASDSIIAPISSFALQGRSFDKAPSPLSGTI